MGGARAAPPPIPIPTPIRKSAHGTAPEMAARTRSAAAQPAAAALRRALPRPRQRQGGGDPRRLFRPERPGDRLADIGQALQPDGDRRGRAQQAKDARIDAARVLAELGRIAFSDIGRIAEWDSDGVALKSNAEIAEADRASIAELAASAGDKSRSARIRLHNKQRALDGIARLLGLYGRGARLPYADPQERMAAAIQSQK